MFISKTILRKEFNTYEIIDINTRDRGVERNQSLEQIFATKLVFLHLI